MDIENLLEEIKDAAFEVRKHLSPGYLEKVYKNALIIELESRGMKVEKEVPLPVIYKGQNVGDYYADIYVEDSVILEIKAVREITTIHEAQLVNYLSITGVDYGYLINYGGEKFRIAKKSRIFNPGGSRFLYQKR
ncbi:MAG: GxxExxY protein [Muribaculaceae bacterium]|nr:GxxExxY protein [Muribaculaceae bacterium]